uniref:Uncharacterized protein n=1 Tax=Anguilla anguilla TaxID=7936 RepID=A0A0E9VMF6_ANGAN
MSLVLTEGLGMLSVSKSGLTDGVGGTVTGLETRLVSVPYPKA